MWKLSVLGSAVKKIDLNVFASDATQTSDIANDLPIPFPQNSNKILIYLHLFYLKISFFTKVYKIDQKLTNVSKMIINILNYDIYTFLSVCLVTVFHWFTEFVTL